jgi:2-dehydro-3-deoxy-D-arabinonate dehydratase
MIRSDSTLTAAEAELAMVLGARGAVMGFTACNDVSAWDLERENPLFLPQAKIYRGCCALGPCLVTPDEIGDPYALQIRCSIIREGCTVFSEAVNTSQLHCRLEELLAWLLKDNTIPPGTVLSTGTGIMVPNELALQDGDRVDIEIQGIGKLSNPVKRLTPKDDTSSPLFRRDGDKSGQANGKADDGSFLVLR